VAKLKDAKHATCTSDPWQKLKECDEIPIGGDDEVIPIVKAGITGVKTFGDSDEIMFQREDFITNIFGIDVTKGAHYERYFPTGVSSAGYMRYPRGAGAKYLGLKKCPKEYKCLDKVDSTPATYFQNHTVKDKGMPISSQSKVSSPTSQYDPNIPGVCRSKCGGGKQFYTSNYFKESCALADLVVWTTLSQSSCPYNNFDFINTVNLSSDAQGQNHYSPTAYKLFERSEASCNMPNNCAGSAATKTNNCVYNASYESMDLEGLKGK